MNPFNAIPFGQPLPQLPGNLQVPNIGSTQAITNALLGRGIGASGAPLNAFQQARSDWLAQRPTTNFNPTNSPEMSQSLTSGIALPQQQIQMHDWRAMRPQRRDF